MAGFVQGVTRELTTIAERLAAKYGRKSAEEVLSDPKLRAEAEQELAGKVRFSKNQPATMQDVEDQAASRALPGTVSVQPDASLRGRLLGAGEGGTPSQVGFDKPLDTDALPPVDLDADMLGRRIKQGAALTAGAGALGYGASGSWGEPEAAGSTEPTEPGAGEPDSQAETVETDSGVDDTMPEPVEEVKQDTSNLDKAMEAFRKYSENYKAQGADTSAIDTKIDQAEKLYKDERKRNETLGLAQLIGQSLARLGASIYGAKQGRSIAPLEFQSIDYGKRSDSAREDYRDTVGSLAARRKEARTSAEKESDDRFKRESAPLKEAISVEEKKLTEANDLASQSLRERIAAGTATKKDVAAAKADARKELESVRKEEATVAKEKQNIDMLVAGIASGVKKDKLANLAGKAGTDLETVEQIMRETNDDFFQSDEEKKSRVDAVKNNLMANIQGKMDELKQRKEAARSVVSNKPAAGKGSTGNTSAPGGYPKQVLNPKTNQKATVQNSKEEKEARAAGFTK